MSCATLNHPVIRIPFFLFVLGIIVIGMLAIAHYVSVNPSPHALERHGVEAVMAHNCINNGGTVQGTFIQSQNGRKATICQIDNLFYIYIEEDSGDEVTSMCKNKMTRLEQVKQYLRNRGYDVPPSP